MNRKILNIITVTRQINDDLTFQFDQACVKTIQEGYEKYGELQITYSPMPNVQHEAGKPWQYGGFLRFTQQFVKYED